MNGTYSEATPSARDGFYKDMLAAILELSCYLFTGPFMPPRGVLNPAFTDKHIISILLN
jgi:hypothetical protein